MCKVCVFLENLQNDSDLSRRGHNLLKCQPALREFRYLRMWTKKKKKVTKLMCLNIKVTERERHFCGEPSHTRWGCNQISSTWRTLSWKAGLFCSRNKTWAATLTVSVELQRENKSERGRSTIVPATEFIKTCSGARSRPGTSLRGTASSCPCGIASPSAFGTAAQQQASVTIRHVTWCFQRLQSQNTTAHYRVSAEVGG